jgi:hypothetical protein
MKKTLIAKSAGLALMCLALAGVGRDGWAQSVTVSTFDSDLRAFIPGNFWHAGPDLPAPTALAWTNSDGGTMLVVNDWDTTTWWQDRKVSADALPFPGYDLRLYGYLEFDAKVLEAVSGTNNAGGWGGIQVVCQGWDGAGDNTNVAWTTLGSITLTSVWAHYTVSTLSFPHYLNRLTLNFFQFPANTNYPTQTQVLIDNIRFPVLPCCPPRLKYEKAVRGLNLFAGSSGIYDRESIRTATNLGIYSWVSNGLVSYSFTVTNFNPGTNGMQLHLFLIPSPGNESSPDWSESNVVAVLLQSQFDGSVIWTLQAKTNGVPNCSGYCPWPIFGQIANPTALGTWTLTFMNDTNVTMTAPGGSSRNFTIPPEVPPLFGGPLSVYFGVQANDYPNLGRAIVLSSVAIQGASVTPIADNFTAPLDTNTWEVIAAYPPSIQVVPSNATWISWEKYNSFFVLETNSVLHNPASWSTNGLPPAVVEGEAIRVLLTTNTAFTTTPFAFPDRGNLFFRLRF